MWNNLPFTSAVAQRSALGGQVMTFVQDLPWQVWHCSPHAIEKHRILSHMFWDTPNLNVIVLQIVTKDTISLKWFFLCPHRCGVSCSKKTLITKVGRLMSSANRRNLFSSKRTLNLTKKKKAAEFKFNLIKKTDLFFEY